MLVIQMLALNFSTVVYLVATWVIHYTVFGRYTAVIPLVLRVSGTTAILLSFALGSPRLLKSTDAARTFKYDEGLNT